MPTIAARPTSLSADDKANLRIRSIADGLFWLTMAGVMLGCLATAACVAVLVVNFVVVFLTAPLGIKEMAPPLGIVDEWAGILFWPMFSVSRAE